MLTKRTLCAIVTLLFSICTHAQKSWQWGKIGGSLISSVGQTPIDEQVVSMTVDQNGNSYVIINAADRVFADDSSSRFATKSYVLVSYACDGRVRWTKAFVPTSATPEIAVDTLGGVYIAGRLQINGGASFDNDTTIAAQSNFKWNFLMKYDTSGKLKWLRYPDDNLQVTNFNNWPVFSKLQVAPNGDIHILAYLSAGIHAGGAYTTNDNAYHVLKYTKDGNFTGGIKLPVTPVMDINNTPLSFTVEAASFLRDHQNGRYYLCGTVDGPYTYPNLYIGNDTLKTKFHGIFIASFDAQGNLKWLKRQDTANRGHLTQAVLGPDRRIYMAGQIMNGHKWNGNTVSAPVASNTFVAYVACVDSNGVNKWLSVAYNPTGSTAQATAIGVSKNGSVRVSGQIIAGITWGNYTVRKNAPPNTTTQYSGFYFASLDPATGTCTGMDSARTLLGIFVSSQFIGSDANNNFYISGMLDNGLGIMDTLITIGTHKLYTVGGTTDFFVAKYGTGNCTSPTTVANSTVLPEIRVYPNPATNTLHIQGLLTQTAYSIYNLQGTRIATGTTVKNIDITDLPFGHYLLRLNHTSLHFIKQN